MLDKANFVSSRPVRKSAARLQSGMYYGDPLSIPTEEEEGKGEVEEALLLSSSDNVKRKRKQGDAPKSPYKVHT